MYKRSVFTFMFSHSCLQIYADIIILFVIFVLLFVVIYYYYKVKEFQNSVTGGKDARCDPKNVGRPQELIAKNSVFVVDGHNAMYSLLMTKGNEISLNMKNYYELLIKTTKLLREALPSSYLHIVIKPYRYDGKKFLAKTKKLVDKKVTYHIVSDTEHTSSNTQHAEKSHDDLLCLLLASRFTQSGERTHLISSDLYRDKKHFTKIKPFNFISINNSIISEETIHPMNEKIVAPNNHFNIRFISSADAKKYDITNGHLYSDTEYISTSKFCLFIIF